MAQSDSHISEKSLITQLTMDDEEAFCEIYARYKSHLYSFAMKFVKSKAFAEDICQDTFMILWQNRHLIDPSLSFSSFLYTIARNRMLYMIRNQRNEERLTEDILYQAIDYNSNSEDFILSNELKLILNAAMSKMTNRQRQIFELSREKGLSHKEIADELAISVYSVQEHISNSLKIIRSEMRAHYGPSYSPSFLLVLLCIVN